MAGDLEFLWIGEKLRGILQDLRQMDNRVRSMENYIAVGTDPALHQAGFAATHFTGYFTFPVRVTEIFTENCYFKARVLKPAWSECAPWTNDDDYPLELRVDVSTSVQLPDVGEDVLAQHVGPHYVDEDWTARYGLFDMVRYLQVRDCDDDPTIFPTNDLKFSCCFDVSTPSPGHAFVDLNVYATGVTSPTGCFSRASDVTSIKFCEIEFDEDWFYLTETATKKVKVGLETDITTVVGLTRIETCGVQVKYTQAVVLCEKGISTDWVPLGNTQVSTVVYATRIGSCGVEVKYAPLTLFCEGEVSDWVLQPGTTLTTVVVDTRIDTATGHLQAKYRTVGVLCESDVSTWTFVSTSTAVTPTVDTRVDAVNMKLQHKYQGMKVFNAEAVSGWIDFHTGTDCAT